MKIQTILRRPIACAAALLSFLGLRVDAQTYTWTQGASGTYDWNQDFNWDPATGFPQAAADVANINPDVSGGELLIRLRQPISVGVINIGDAVAELNTNTVPTLTLHPITIANQSGEFHVLTLDSGTPGVTAQINLGSSGITTNTFNVPITLNSPLTVDVGGTDTANAQRVVFSNTIVTNDQPITINGGFFNSGAQTTISGTIFGGADAVITNNSASPLLINGVQSGFFGKIVVNNRATGSNQAGLTVHHTGSLADAGEFEINGYLSGGATQNGGTVHVGQGSTIGTNPGQRLTRNVITFNGGSLNAGGQPLAASVEDKNVRDEVALVRLNSGYSLLSVTSTSNATPTSSRTLDVAMLERSPGASIFVRAAQFGNPTAINATTMFIGNVGTHLRGSGGSGTDMSIIPWMAVANTNASAQSSDSFATYTSDGVRGLNTSTEYAGAITAGAEHNISTGTLGIAGSGNGLTINSLRHSTSGVGNLGSDNTLAVASGGIIFATNNGGIGVTGDSNAGTLQFGTNETPAEGVVWSNGSNTNTIGASITGTAGLSKAGTGTLILTGADNTFSGLTYVGSGVLQVGNNGIFSTLGASNEVKVAAGALLSLTGGNMIADTATLRLEQFGLFNGKATLFPEVNDTIGALWLGDQMMAAGTYGALGSGATFEDDQWFSGTGVLTVVPEPASAVFLLAGLGVTLARRRRH